MASYELELITDKQIEKLEKAEAILKEIKQLDCKFSLSNIIEIDKDSILVFNLKEVMYKQEDIQDISKQLCDALQMKCLVLPSDIELNKAINKKRYVYNVVDGLVNEVRPQ